MQPNQNKTKSIIIGGVSGFILGILGNLLASWIQQELLENSFTPLRIGLIIACTILGIFIMFLVEIKSASIEPDVKKVTTKNNVYSNVKLFWSKFKTRGKGVQMDDITAIGSEIDIDTK